IKATKIGSHDKQSLEEHALLKKHFSWAGVRIISFEFGSPSAQAEIIMNPPAMRNSSEPEVPPTTRRRFLKQTVGLAASAAVLSELPQSADGATSASEALLPTIKLGR